MRAPGRDNRSPMELKMTPMIDVVFLLLVFFLWSSSFELPEFDLPSSLAEPPAGLSDIADAAPPPEAFDELVITVARRGDALSISLNGTVLHDTQALAARLGEIVSLGAQPPVIVDPSPDTDVASVITIYDTARAAGLDRVLFAAEE